MTMPLMHSAACCTIEPDRVTGAVAPAKGMLTISAGTPASARSTRLCEANSDQFRGGEGQTSKIARGLLRSASVPPLSIASSYGLGNFSAKIRYGFTQGGNGAVSGFLLCRSRQA